MPSFFKIHLPSITALVLCGFICFCSSCSESVLDLSAEQPIELGPITYDADIQLIMTTRCSGCHGGASPDAGLFLTSFETVLSAAENGNLLARVVNASDPMPPSGLIPALERQMIQQWADDGFPEN